MSRIAIGSMFRDASGYIDRYTQQLASLSGMLTGAGFDVHFIQAVGDSRDDTWDKLRSRMDWVVSFTQNVSPDSKLDLFQLGNTGPVYGSIDNADRWRHISAVCNRVLERVEDDYFLYVESDLVWEADTMSFLLGDLDLCDFMDTVSPLCIHEPTGRFYDIWGYRKNGVNFKSEMPYHPGISTRLTPIDSAGSCIAMRGFVAKACRFNPPELGIVGFCQDIRKHGYRLYVDPCLTVYHP